MGDSAHKPLPKDAARPSRVRERIQRKQRGSRYAASKWKLCCPVGSRARARGSGSVRTPRWVRIFFAVPGSVTVARRRIRASHLGQRRESKPNVRRSSTDHSMREDVAKSSPSSRRAQCLTVSFPVLAVGSTRATGTVRASEVALSSGASGDPAGGLGGVSVPVAVGPEGAGDGAGGCVHRGLSALLRSRVRGRLRRHERAPRRAGGKDAVISNERKIRRGDQRKEILMLRWGSNRRVSFSASRSVFPSTVRR